MILHRSSSLSTFLSRYQEKWLLTNFVAFLFSLVPFSPSVQMADDPTNSLLTFFVIDVRFPSEFSLESFEHYLDNTKTGRHIYFARQCRVADILDTLIALKEYFELLHSVCRADLRMFFVCLMTIEHSFETRYLAQAFNFEKLLKALDQLRPVEWVSKSSRSKWKIFHLRWFSSFT